jgi:phytanoyl-CoA hydroxylase
MDNGDMNVATRFFRDTGYLLVKNCLPSNLLAEARDQAAELFADAAEPVRRNEPGDVVRISRVFERGGAINQLLSCEQLMTRLEALLGPNVELVLNRHNHLTRSDPFGKAQRLHRDVLQWSRPVVTALLYLDGASDAVSATHVIPSSHILPFVGTPNNGGTWLDEHHVFAAVREQSVPVPTQPGDVLLLDGLVFHAMGKPGDGSRLLVTGAFRSVDELVSAYCEDEHVLLRGERLYRGDS